MNSTQWDRYLAWTAADIVAMKGVEQENRHLDFKLLAKPDLGKDDQHHLAKAASGFANADGGVIVWGVNARRDPDEDNIDQVFYREKLPVLGQAAAKVTAQTAQAAVEAIRQRTPGLVWKSARGEYSVDDAMMHTWYAKRVAGGKWPPKGFEADDGEPVALAST